MWIHISSDTLHICILLFPSTSMPKGWHLGNSSSQLPCSPSGPKVPLCNLLNGCKGSSSYPLAFSLKALTGSMNTHRAAEPGCRTAGKKPQWCCFQKPHVNQHTANNSPHVKVPSLYAIAPGLCCHLSCTQTLLGRELAGTDQRHNRDHFVILMSWVIKFQSRVTLLGI